LYNRTNYREVMEDRKARLAALAARAGRGAGGGASTDSQEDVAAVGASLAPIQDRAADSNEGQDQEQTRYGAEQEPSSSSSTEKAPPPALKFRNYSAAPAASGIEGDESGLPATKKARRTVTATSGNDSKPSIGASLSSSNNNKPPKSALELALEKAATAAPAFQSAVASAAPDGADGDTGGAVAALAPKKINWDLKRDIQPKLNKLDRRTQRAIVQLLQERLGRDADASAATSSNNGAAGVEELD
jgi:coiled-coil domain-containing protein 12